MNDHLESAPIEVRMRDYFERQIAWFNEMLCYVVEAASDMERGEVDRAVKEHRSREKELTNFSDEFWSLKNEWEIADNIPTHAREEIATLARRADALSRDVRAGLDKDGALAAALGRDLEGDLGKLRAGKQILDRYRPGLTEIADFVDRKA